MREIDKFVENLGRKIGESRQAQLRFAVCTSVDWTAKTMRATGVADDTDYVDVQLGFGYIDIKPAVGSVCLIGISEGKEALTFLINAEEAELVEIKAGKTVFNGGDNGGLVKSEPVAQKISDLEKEFNKLKNIFSSWITVPQDGGASLKTAIASWASQTIAPIAKKEDFESDKITH